MLTENMIQILKYLKKHAIGVLFIIVLLVVQAYCDLALPNYTSKIVDVGIQNGGIEHASPEVIRATEFEKVKLFLTEEESSIVEKAYKKISFDTMNEEEKNATIKKYPIVTQEELLELVANKKEIESVDQAMQSALMVVKFFSTDSEELSQVKEEMFQGMPMAENMDIFSVLSQVPYETRMEMRTKMTEQLGTLSDTLLEQSAVSYVKAEYEAIDVDMDQLQYSYLFEMGMKMLGFALLAMFVSIVVCYIASRIAANIGMTIRGKLFKKVVSFSNTEMEHFSIASLITRSTNDIQQIQMVVVMLLRMVCYAPILGIGGVLKVLSANRSMTWIIFIAVSAVLCLVLIIFCVAMPKFKVLQDKVDRVNLVAREILTGLSVIRAFGTEKHEEKRFDRANTELTRTQLFTNRVMTTMMPMMMFIMNAVAVAIIWFGAKRIDLGELQVGDMMAFITYTMQIIMAFLMITMISIMLPRAAISAKRVDNVLNTELVLKDPENEKTFEKAQQGVLAFEDVSFKYPDAEENALEHISFTAKPGQVTAFIGSTGSGKSTLVNLIPRFYDVTEGKICLGGIDIRDISQEKLRDEIGYVPQKGILFSGTIESNLKYGNENLSEDDMKKAARIAQSTEFIEAKPEQYLSPIAQGGNNVSGGQKQRLSIARAIAKNPQVYIFDDSFSALDYKTDVALRKALNEETTNKTVLIVAQRISTIIHADQIIVLDEGKVVGKGTHEELLETNEAYQQIAYSQLSKSELEGGNK